MVRIEFDWLGFHLMEPMSLITNSLVSILCLICYFKIVRNTSYSIWWSRFFVLMSISTFAGGLAHLFGHYITYELKWICWGASALSIMSAEMASSELLLRKKWRNFIRIQAVVRVAAVFVTMFILFDFNIVKVNSTLGMIAVTVSIHLIYFIKKKLFASAWIMAGIVWAIVPTLIHTFDINLHLWFNRDDFAHVVMLPTFLMIFIGVSKIINSQFIESHTKRLS